jgi:cytochrome c biogenesis protein ResB
MSLVKIFLVILVALLIHTSGCIAKNEVSNQKNSPDVNGGFRRVHERSSAKQKLSGGL